MASSYSPSFYRALSYYPTLLTILSGTIGFRKPKELRDRQHWRNATQQALKLVSSIHAILTSVLAARDVFDEKWTSLNLITTRSSDANSVVGVEAGYLIQDTLVCALLDSKYSPVNTLVQGSEIQRIKFEGLLLTHHISLASLLTLFLQFAKRKKEKGVFFVEMFLLMNASTPLLNLRWWLQKRSSRVQSMSTSQMTRIRKISNINEGALVVTFFACRIGLIFYMLWIYGLRTRRSILQSYMSIPLQCKTGTAALLILNSLWWMNLCRKTLLRVKQKSV